MTKTYVVISDTQIPYHDRKATKAVINFVREFQPDEVVHIGDLMDYPQPSRWNKDTRGEFEGSVYEDSEDAKRLFLTPLREAYAGRIGVIEGNHDERPRTYLEKYAPALSGSTAFHFENLLDFAGFEISKLPEFYTFAPDWLMTHGHKGKISLSRIAGNTALNAAKSFGVSVIMGHTHRLAVTSHSSGWDQAVKKTVTGMEVGNLMDMKQAHYLKGGTANWQQGFGIVRVDGKHVKAETVMINGGKFTVDGVTYAV